MAEPIRVVLADDHAVVRKGIREFLESEPDITIVAEAVDLLQPLLDKHAQRIIVQLPTALPVVLADPKRTIQVLVNLLSNANRYGPDASDIEITAKVREPWIWIAVADSGPGVPREYRKTVFRRFRHPAAGNNQAQYGVGLGLSVVKAVVEAQGGHVGIKERPGGGAVFWFTLPIAEEEEDLTLRSPQ